MSADLHIHAFKGITQADLEKCFSNTLGSKYFAPRTIAQSMNDDSYSKVCDTPSVWIGEVSWLKAALTDDADAYVPDPVSAIHDLIGENLPVLDDALEQKILAALGLDNSTSYSVADASKVIDFLKEYKGHQLFTVSW